MGTTSDLQLVEQWRAGDAAAGNQLFERHFESVYRFFVHKAPGEAVDLVQRTFLACIEARDRFRGASSFRTYLFAIARHELLGHWRKRSNIVDSGATSVRDLSPSPSALLLRRFEHRVLLEALRAIPIDLQIALELHYWEGLSTSEIGEVLGVPDGTAKSRLRRAREALEQRIAALEEDPEQLRTTLSNLDAWAASLKQAIVEERHATQ